MFPAALKVYHKSLANVDFLHGSAESMLTLTNLFIGELLLCYNRCKQGNLSILSRHDVRSWPWHAVLGLRKGIRQAEQANQQKLGPQGEDPATSKRPADAAQQQ